MAYKDFDGLSGSPILETGKTIQIDGSTVDLPDASFVTDATMERDGMDLVLDGPQGTLMIEDYFSAAQTPDLIAPDGSTLTPELVNSFARSPSVYAQSQTMTDESPVGSVNEISGEATITRLDGSIEPITRGTPVYQGDVIETGAEGAVNIAFIDETSFAVSESARLAIDEYVFDPATEAGSQNFSVLKGVFVFTSGLIGRDDPDDVNIDTPSGSIGIRGTIIAGNVDSGEITVIEGAIVVRDLSGNEMTLANQFETAKFDLNNGEIQNLGQLPAQEVSSRFSNVSNVSPTLFSSINDAMEEQGPQGVTPQQQDSENTQQPGETPQEQDTNSENFDASNSVDQNNDNKVDSTLDEQNTENLDNQENPSDDAGDQGDANTPDSATGEEAGVDAAGEGSVNTTKPSTMPNGMGMDNTSGINTNNNMNTNNTGTGMDTSSQASAVMSAETDMDMARMEMMEERTEKRQDTLDQMKENAYSEQYNDPNDPASNETSFAGLPNQGGSGPFSSAPVHIKTTFPDNPNTAPDEFFTLSNNVTWLYDFNQEFFDPDQNAGDSLTFRLTDASKQALIDNIGDENTNWSFNEETGSLDISPPTIANSTNFEIGIEAFDQDGNNSGVHSYQINLLKTSEPVPADFNDINNSVFIIGGPNPPAQSSTVTIGGTQAQNNDIFIPDAVDTIALAAGADNNSIYLSTLENTSVNIAEGAQDNVIFGGRSADTITLADVNNTVFGMGGDDIIKINVGPGSQQLSDLTTAGLDIELNGGASAFYYQNIDDFSIGASNPISGPGGFGDTLQFLNSGSTAGINLDFTAVENGYIRGIERIDLKTNTSDDVITLDLESIMEMTDQNNILIIRRGANDTIQLDEDDFDLGSDIISPNTVTFEEDDGMTDFTVIQKNGVTLLIEGNDANIVAA